MHKVMDRKTMGIRFLSASGAEISMQGLSAVLAMGHGRVLGELYEK